MQSVDGLASTTPTISSVRTEQAPTAPHDSAGSLAAAKGSPKEPRLSDEDLGQLAHNVHFIRLYLEYERDVLAARIGKELERLQSSGALHGAQIVGTLLAPIESRLCEAMLLDNVYDDARRKKDIPSQKLSYTEEAPLLVVTLWLPFLAVTSFRSDLTSN